MVGRGERSFEGALDGALGNRTRPVFMNRGSLVERPLNRVQWAVSFSLAANCLRSLASFGPITTWQ